MKTLNRKTHAGFTLLELLASMAILAVLMTLLFAAFSQASRGWLQAENRVETFTQARAALDYMSKELSQAIATTNISFLGDPSGIAFIAPVSTDTNDVVDLEEVVYQVNGGSLERQATAFSDGANWNFYSNPQNWPNTTGRTNSLADNVVLLTLSYVGTNGVPVSSWNSTTALAWSGTILPGTTTVMTNRTPAGVQIILEVIDSKTAKRLQPGMSATTSNNIIKPARKEFTTFVAIPNRQP